MKTIVNNEPTVNEVELALESGKIVLFKSHDGVQFMLNPFGGGISRTNEYNLPSDFKVNNENVRRMIIVNLI